MVEVVLDQPLMYRKNGKNLKTGDEGATVQQ